MNDKQQFYRGISKDELNLISRAEYSGLKLITGEFANSVIGEKKKTSNILSRLVNKGRLIRISRGKYFIVPIRAPKQLWAPNEFITAKYWIGTGDYYLGYYTMYNYWGFTGQIPRSVYVLNTEKSYSSVIKGVEYNAVKISPLKYYGTAEIEIEGEKITISDKERTLVDFIYKPTGTFESMKQIVKEVLSGIDYVKLCEYLIKYPEIAVRKRAGYLIQEAGADNKLIVKLKKSFDPSRTNIVLNPFNRSRKGKVNKEWGLIIND